jgi:tetratricopeptide (TPR) repeat protein
LKPNFAAAHNGLGVMFFKLGRHRESVEAFSRAVTSNSNYAVARYNLGVGYVALKNKSAALEQHRSLQPLNPELARALFGAIYQGRILSVRR